MAINKFSELPEFIGQIKNRAQNLKPALDAASDDYKETIIDKAFASETSPLGEAWQPLKPSTIAKKGNSKILRDSGALMRGASVGFGKKSIFSDVKGAARTYANVHLLGSPSQNIPERPWLPLTDSGDLSFKSGPAQKWLNRTMKTIIKYIWTGKIK